MAEIQKVEVRREVFIRETPQEQQLQRVTAKSEPVSKRLPFALTLGRPA
jgi:hypothetical protein